MPAYESVARPLLFRLDPERAHELILRAAELGGRIAPARALAGRLYGVHDERLRTTFAGLQLDNPLGLAAGFDKNGRAVAMLGSLGFGHVEIGSVSAQPSAGNPRPRLFRIPEDRGIVVAYGVPNEGAAVVAKRLDRTRRGASRLGVNLVKTNDPAHPAVEPDVYEDYARSFALLQDRADYVALNLSCPNSAADRDFFDDVDRIDRLLVRLAEVGPRVPVVLKLKPTTDAGVLREIVAIAERHEFVRGLAINLPAGKPPELRLTTAKVKLARMPGAVGGPPVEEYVNGILATLHGIAGERFQLMAAGGVASAEAAYRKLALGASVVQLYTGLVYRGPRVIREVLDGLLQLLERDGHASVADAVGSAAVRV